MKLHTAVGILVTLAAVGTARAEDNASIPEPVGFERGYVWIDPAKADIAPQDVVVEGGSVSSRIIFLNRCVGGCTIRPGFESSINNTSSIIDSVANIGEFAPNSDSTWNAVVQCVRNMYAPFDIEITDVDPGNVPHWENIVAGSPTQAGFGNGTGGVSPFSCGIINNSITYTFANIYGGDVEEICWTVAQETAHSWGLEHEVLATDPMTYLGAACPGGAQNHAFQNQNAPCGECSARSCDCGGTTQNSYQDILGIFGSAEPSPPVVTIVDPLSGEAVSPGFSVEVEVADSNGVASVRLEVDGQASGSITTQPYILDSPSNLGEGVHVVKVTATDTQGTEGSTSINVVIGEPCETPGDCSQQGENLTCVGGRCVPGSGAPGGLGTDCVEDTECSSGRCEHSNEGSYCVEACEPGGDDCPGGFQCLSAGVCWPGEGDGGGCLSADTETPTLPIALGIAFAALLVPRRRRRK